MTNIITPRLIYTNQTLESQKNQLTSLPEGPIRSIPPEIVVFILFLTEQNHNTRLVSSEWNDLTFLADAPDKKSKQQELEQFIQLLTGIFIPNYHAKYLTCVAEIQDVYHSLSRFLDTCTKTHCLFLIAKGFVIDGFRKVPEEEKAQIQEAMGHRLSDFMKDFFELSRLSHAKSNDIDTGFTLLQSRLPLSIGDRGQAVHQLANTNNIEFVKSLLANGPILEVHRGVVVEEATKHNNPELVKLLLDNGPISEVHRERAFALALANENNNLKLIQLLRKLSITWKIITALGRDVAVALAYIWEVAVKLKHWVFKK